MTAIRITLQVLLVLTSLFLMILLLLHKGKGGGLSDMFGGGGPRAWAARVWPSATSTGSRSDALLWVGRIVLLGVLERFTTTF